MRSAVGSGPPLPGDDDVVEVGVAGCREVPHGTYHRSQAPTERAMAASIATAQVKRARFAFTDDSL
jgi:hypothetical protein